MIQRINLIPEEIGAKKVKISLPIKYFVVVALGLLYIIPIHMHITAQSKGVDAQKFALEAKKLELVTRNMRYASLQKKIDNKTNALALLKKKSIALKDIVQNRIFWSDILKEMSFYVPDSLWLNEIRSYSTSIDIEDVDGEDDDTIIEKNIKEVKLRGSSYNNKLITEFVENLEGSYFLEDIKLNFTEKRVIKDVFIVYDFEITSKLKALY